MLILFIACDPLRSVINPFVAVIEWQGISFSSWKPNIEVPTTVETLLFIDLTTELHLLSGYCRPIEYLILSVFLFINSLYVYGTRFFILSICDMTLVILI
jgi:hypothetical protein